MTDPTSEFPNITASIPDELTLTRKDLLTLGIFTDAVIPAQTIITAIESGESGVAELLEQARSAQASREELLERPLVQHGVRMAIHQTLPYLSGVESTPGQGINDF